MKNDENIHTLSFKPEPRTPNIHRITPYHVSSGEQESKLLSRKENNALAKINLTNMDRTMQKFQHIASIIDVRPQNT